jgi:signal peptidase I
MMKRPVFWVATIVAAAAVLAALAVSAGLRFYTVMTPSMGTTAPVGTLVVTRPAPTYRVGDIVTYERDDRSYTHRIITANPDGTFITKGDLNGAADPLPVTPEQVVGHAVWLGPGLGWLWQGLPWLMLGGLAVYALSLVRPLDRTWQWIVRISGWTLVFCLVAVWLRPWVSLTQLAYEPSDLGGVIMHVVNTGLFPLDVLGTRLTSGQDTMVHVTEQNAHGLYTLTPTLGFYWWEQVGLFLLCLIPFGLSFLIRAEEVTPARALPEVQRAEPDESGDGSDPGNGGEADGAETEWIGSLLEPEPAPDEPAAPSAGDGVDKDRRRRLILTSAIVLAIVISVSVISFASTSAALTAKVTNSTNTTGTRTYYNCADAVSSTANPVPFLAWALGTARSATSNEPDVSGNNRTGRYLVASTVNSSVGCRGTTASVVFDGKSQCLYQYGNPTATAPTTFSIEAWFMTNSKALNGKIIGLGSSRNTSSDNTYDRHIYLDKAGRIVFGVYYNEQKIVATPVGPIYNDGNWHHVVGTYSTSAGMTLYVDGVAVATAPQPNINADTGYWKVGCGTLSTWTDAGGATTTEKPAYFTGQIQYAAVYTTVLTAAQVQEHYLAGAG